MKRVIKLAFAIFLVCNNLSAMKQLAPDLIDEICEFSSPEDVYVNLAFVNRHWHNTIHRYDGGYQKRRNKKPRTIEIKKFNLVRKEYCDWLKNCKMSLKIKMYGDRLFTFAETIRCLKLIKNLRVVEFDFNFELLRISKDDYENSPDLVCDLHELIIELFPKNIETLELRSCYFKSFPKHRFSNLKSLTVFGPNVSITIWNNLPQTLETLHIGNFTRVRNRWYRLDNLKQIKNLKTISFKGELFYNEILDSLPQSIETLDLRYEKGITHLKWLKNLPNLKRLRLSRFKNGNPCIKEDGFQVLQDSSLEELDFSSSRDPVFTDKVITFFPKSLKKLHLQGASHVTGVGLQRLKKLKILNISNTGATDKALEDLTELPLQELYLSNCTKLSNVVLKKCAQLKELDLSDTEVTDHVLANLPKNLKYLSLSNCKSITADGLRYLAELEKLEELNLLGTTITTKVLDFLLGSLKNLKKCLLIYGCWDGKDFAPMLDLLDKYNVKNDYERRFTHDTHF